MIFYFIKDFSKNNIQNTKCLFYPNEFAHPNTCIGRIDA